MSYFKKEILKFTNLNFDKKDNENQYNETQEVKIVNEFLGQ